MPPDEDTELLERNAEGLRRFRFGVVTLPGPWGQYGQGYIHSAVIVGAKGGRTESGRTLSRDLRVSLVPGPSIGDVLRPGAMP